MYQILPKLVVILGYVVNVVNANICLQIEQHVLAFVFVVSFLHVLECLDADAINAVVSKVDPRKLGIVSEQIVGYSTEFVVADLQMLEFREMPEQSAVEDCELVEAEVEEHQLFESAEDVAVQGFDLIVGQEEVLKVHERVEDIRVQHFNEVAAKIEDSQLWYHVESSFSHNFNLVVLEAKVNEIWKSPDDVVFDVCE
jgi:hypothetical protein